MLRTWDQFSDNLIYHLVKNELAPFDNAEKAGTPFEYEHRFNQKTGKPATLFWKTPSIYRGAFSKTRGSPASRFFYSNGASSFRSIAERRELVLDQVVNKVIGELVPYVGGIRICGSSSEPSTVDLIAPTSSAPIGMSPVVDQYTPTVGISPSIAENGESPACGPSSESSTVVMDMGGSLTMPRSNGGSPASYKWSISNEVPPITPSGSPWAQHVRSPHTPNGLKSLPTIVPSPHTPEELKPLSPGAVDIKHRLFMGKFEAESPGSDSTTASLASSDSPLPKPPPCKKPRKRQLVMPGSP